MTKKDYKLLARVVAELNPITTKELVVEKLATALKRDSPNFNEREFIKACYSK